MAQQERLYMQSRVISIMRSAVLVVWSSILPFTSCFAGRTYTPQEEQAQRVLSKNSALFELIPGRVNRAYRSIGNRLENYKAGRLRIMRNFVEQVERKIQAIQRLRDDMYDLMKDPGTLRRRTRHQITDLLKRIEAYEEAARSKLKAVRKDLRHLEKQLRVQPGSFTNREEEEALIRGREKAVQDRKRASLDNILDKAERFEGKSLEEVMNEIAKEQKAIDAQIEEDDLRDEEIQHTAGAVLSDEDAVEAALKSDDIDALVDALATKSRRPVVQEKDETVEVINEFGSELKQDATNLIRGIFKGYRAFKRGLGALLHKTEAAVFDNTKSLRALNKAIRKRSRRLKRENHNVQATPELRAYVHGKLRRVAEASLEGYRTLKRRIGRGSKRIARGATVGVVEGVQSLWHGIKNLPSRMKKQFARSRYQSPKNRDEIEGLPGFTQEVGEDAKATIAKLHVHAKRLAAKARDLTDAGAAAAERMLERVRKRIYRLKHGTDVHATPELYKKATQGIDATLTAAYTTLRDLVGAGKDAVIGAGKAVKTVAVDTGSLLKRSARSAASTVTRGLDATRATTKQTAQSLAARIKASFQAIVDSLKTSSKAVYCGVDSVCTKTVGGVSRVVRGARDVTTAGATRVASGVKGVGGWFKRMFSAIGARVKHIYKTVSNKVWEVTLGIAHGADRVRARVQAEMKRAAGHVHGAYKRLRGDVQEVVDEVAQLPEKILPGKNQKPLLPLAPKEEASQSDVAQAQPEFPQDNVQEVVEKPVNVDIEVNVVTDADRGSSSEQDEQDYDDLHELSISLSPEGELVEG